MRIVLTITLGVLLALGVVAINNNNNNSVNYGFAQEGFQTEDLVNETIDIGNNTATATANATLAYAAEHWSKKGEEYRKMGEHIGKEFRKMGEDKGKEYRKMGEDIGKEFESIEKDSINKNSTITTMNGTLSMSLEGNNTAKPMNATFPMS
jgi:DNA-binding protein H-NS